MDDRIPLKKHTILPFDGMYCHLEEVVGCGSNAVVYRGWYRDGINTNQIHHVLIKELFPFHPQRKVYRLEDGRICVDPDARDYWNLHKSSFLRGNEIHLRLLADHPEQAGANLNSFQLNDTLYSVLGYSGGRSLQTELGTEFYPLRIHVKRMLLLLDALEAFHKSGYLHLDISPDNIMLTGTENRESMFLIDYNSAAEVGDTDGVYFSFKPGYSSPEVELGQRDKIGYPSDLYSVAAVFYRCIMGRPLTLQETLRAKAPDGKDSPCLHNVPQTVADLVKKILQKGLNTLPQKRYKTIGQMRQAFSELMDRIDCVGITHWSLWERGRQVTEQRIRTNPALAFLCQERNIYPIRVTERNATLPLDAYLDRMISPGGTSALLLAEGGMGKSTLLLRAAQILGRTYSRLSPAVFYISLNGCSGSESTFIVHSILRTLRFKKGENSYEDALQALHQLLRTPRTGKTGPVPSVILLLDGFNEIRGDAGGLLQEIRELSAMPGVRMMVSSRSPLPDLEFPICGLSKLEQQDILHALGDNGLMEPQNPEVMMLLRTPMILSLFIQSGQSGLQPEVHTCGELIDVYLHTLLQKEINGNCEDSSQRWQTEAALLYVLPCIAAEEKRRSTALTEAQILAVLKRCRRFLRSGQLKKTFPQWIGHSRELFGDAENPEQWYGLVIHKLLWRRLGLLIRESSGGYRIYHQEIRDHLAAKKCVHLEKKRLIRCAAGWVLAGAIVVGAVLSIPALRWHDDQDVEQAIDYAAVGYATFGMQYEQLRNLTDAALSGQWDELSYLRVLSAVEAEATWTNTEQLYLQHIQQNILPEENRIVSWSGQSLDGELSEELIQYATERADYYRQMLPLLAVWMDSEQARKDSPDFLNAFSQVLEADANLAGELYQQSCAVHLKETADELWQKNIRDLIGQIPLQDAHRNLQEMEDRDQYLENLRSFLAEAERQLTQAAAPIKWNQ